MTKEKIDLVQDPKMYSFFERGIRGGLIFVYKHILSNEIINHDNNRLINHLANIDRNDLYSFSMCISLPHSEFSSIENINSFSREFILNVDDEGE